MITLRLLGDREPVLRPGHELSGFGGINGIPIPDFLSRTAHPDRLYFVTLAVALLVFADLRYVARTPFGLTLQGIRDDPVRMRSLGYNVALHRTLAFAFAGFIAAIGGILFVWWNAQIAPSTIGLERDHRRAGHRRHRRPVPARGRLAGRARLRASSTTTPRTSTSSRERFHTLIGVIFLVIVLVSPNGLIGLWERATSGRRRTVPGDITQERGSAEPTPVG